MDERKLTELFGDAVPDVPPPSFDQHDVIAESGRQRLRRRNALMGGSALGIALIVGATVLGVALWRGPDAGMEATSVGGARAPVATSNGGRPPNELSKEAVPPSQRAASGGEQDKSFSVETPEQGGTPTGNAGPSGPGSTSSGCEQADPELAAALAGELRAAAPDTAVRANVVCPRGSRAAAFTLTENGRTGLVTIVLTPPGTFVDFPVTGSPEGTVVGAATTPNGRHLFVITELRPPSVEAPYAGDMQSVADRLAARI